MFTKAVVLLAGITALSFFSDLPSIYVSVGISLLLTFISLAFRGNVRRCIILCLIGSLGFNYALICAKHRTAWQLPKSLISRNVKIIGSIDSLPVEKDGRVSFLFKVYQLNEKSVAIKAQLNWYGRHPTLHLGDCWQFIVRLKRPWGKQNPGGFDYEKWLFAHNIRVTGYVRQSVDNQLLRRRKRYHFMQFLRDKLNSRLNQILYHSPFLGLIKALTIGGKNQITQGQWQVFRITGTSHLMAISGLHIGLVAGLSFFVFSFCWRLLPNLTLYVAAPQVGAVGAVFAALFYSLLAGFGLPAQRSFIMVTVFMLSLFFCRQLRVWHAYSIALIVVLLFNPFSTLLAGFWLSFAAVGALIYGMQNAFSHGNFWRRYAKVQYIITLGLMPINILFFKSLSVLGLIANIFAVPVVGFLVVPLSLVGVLLLLFNFKIAGFILHFSTKIILIVWYYLSWLGELPFTVWHHAAYHAWIFILAIIGVLWALFFRKISIRCLGMALLLPLFFYTPKAPKKGEIWLTLLDVGQGLSAVIQTATHVLVYDIGAKFTPGSDMGKTVVLPFLYYKNIRKVDTLVVSHGDNDHIGGAKSLLAAMPVGGIITSAVKRFPNRKVVYCYEGLHWQWDGVKFQFLFPTKNAHFKGKNNHSCVLKISASGNSVLLPGDIEKLVEYYLLRRKKTDLAATILIAPHHGSKTSSTQPFVKAVNPRYVLFPVGYYNRFHFPVKSVLHRYHNIGAKTFLTSRSGAIILKLRKEGIELHRYRQTHYHYWFSQ